MKKDSINEIEGILFVGYFLSSHSHGRCVCEDLSIEFEKRGYRIVTTSNKLNRYSRILDIIKTILLRRDDYQVAYIEVYNGLAFIWAEIACSLLDLLKKPYIITLHGARLIQFSEKWPNRVRRMISRADIVTTPSKLFQMKFKKWRSDIIYLPNAIDLNIYHYKLRSAPSSTLGWLRKFEKNYNPLLAIKTLSNLVSEYPSIILFMGGGDIHDGSSAEVNRFTSENELSQHLEICGFINHSEKYHWFDNFDVFLNTTFVESFGIAVLEAAASGLCIITTNVGELPYLWKDGVDALLVPPDDSAAMTTAVRRILTEPGLAARLSANARKKAEQYDWSVVLPQWEALFEEVINNA